MCCVPKRVDRHRRAILPLVALVAGCAVGEVEISLAPNKYLILPFATAEVASGQLELAAKGLPPLAAGARYACWLTSGAASRPAKHLGALAAGRLTVAEQALGVRFADYDGLLCTVEREPSPAQPSADVALRGAPGGMLRFGDAAVLAELGAASASCRIDGMNVACSYHGLPPLPEGFRYGLYLEGTPPPVDTTISVGSTHQHLASGEASAAPPLRRIGWLEAVPDGEAGYREPGGLNLTGHRKALLSIEAAAGADPPTIFALIGPKGATPPPAPAASAPPPPAQTAGDYVIELELSATDVHPGDVITFTFRVSQKSAPVSGLTPLATYAEPSGKTGSIALAPGAEAGSYSGRKAFFADGRHEIRFSFSADGQEQTANFEILVQAH